MKYDAFISYRHSELDMELAKKIHSGLENYHVPKAVQKRSGKKGIKRVFRDQEELPIGSDLDDNISRALSDSEYLIVICSPRTPESYWVCKEIDTFIEMHDRQHVLAVLVEGEPNESFPIQLLKDENGNPVEPLAADVRGATAKERNKKLKTELLRLAAPLLGCTYDDLRQRHRERRIRRITALVCSLSAILATLGIGFAIYNAKMVAEIEKNYNEAVANYDLAVENYDLAVKNYDMAMENYEQAMLNQYKYMADLSGTLLEDGYREDAVLLGLEAFSDKKSGGEKVYVPQAEYALSQALYTYDTGTEMSKDRMLEHRVPVTDFRYDYDKCHLLTVEQNYCVCVWDVNNGKQICRITPTDNYDMGPDSICAFDHIDDEVVIATNYSAGGYSMEGKENWKIDYERADSVLLDGESGQIFVQNSNEIALIDFKLHKIVNRYEISIENAIFSDKMKLDAANGRLYVGCYGDENSYIEVISLSGDESVYFELPRDTISEFAICEDGDVISVTDYAAELLQMGSYTVCVQRTDINSKEKIWSREFEQMTPDMESGTSVKIKYRNIQDENGEWHSEVVFAENNQVTCMNANTGETISSLNMSGTVKSLLLSASGPLGYAALNTGNIYIINLETGYVYSSEVIETGVPIKDICIANGVIAVRCYASPDVLLMKYHMGRSMEELLSLEEDSISQIYASSDGRYLAVNVTEVGNSTSLYIGDRKTGDFSLITVTEDECYSPMKMGFIPDNRFILCGMEDTITYINPSDLTKTTIQLDNSDIIGVGEVRFFLDNQYAAIFKGSVIYLYDLISGKISYENNNVGSEIIDVSMTDSGLIYILTEDEGLLGIDVNTGDITPILKDLTDTILREYTGRHICVNNAGDKLALVSSDCMLRVIDITKADVIFEKEFRSTEESFIRFSRDDSVIVTQDDDYYIRIYDAQNGENKYTSSIQYKDIIDITENEENSVMSITSMNSMLVLDKGSYIPVANIKNGRLLTSDGEVISANATSLYGFKYQTATSLIEDAREQFGETELSEAKKIKYHIGDQPNINQ